MSAAPYTLYDMPVSNNGARVRMILYYKDVPASDVAIVSPMELGGLRSDEFLAVNPQGKMPALVCRDEGLAGGPPSSARWASRDDADATIFDKILAGDIPSDKVYEDDLCYAFRDINPVAPTHVLLIPKVGAVAEAAGLGDAGYRLVVNDGADACQTVFHLHLHIIGGRELAWPPG
ncbi:histidine triad nucleotide-binding protein [Aureococcus anophagefferens]|uniref:Histidine triad nucleotide-binding protein n=1 Tax=Aureococcus anophagefferens TaxID=44056 RepID=A0ABR1FLE1_AURAN